MSIVVFFGNFVLLFRPMDLQQMDERLESGQYMTFTDFRNDFKLIVNNCRLYNGQNNGKSQSNQIFIASMKVELNLQLKLF